MDSSPEPSPKQDSEVEVSDQEEGGKQGSEDEEGPSERSASESEDEEVVGKSSPRKKSGSESEQEEQQSSPPRKERKSSGSESEKSNRSERSDKESDNEEQGRKSSRTKDIFGSDSDEEDDGEKRRVERQGSRSPSVEREGEEEGRGSPIVHRESQLYEEEEDGVGREEEKEPPQEIRISAQIPRMVADLGSEMYFVKFPNFLSVDTHPFDASWYEDEIDEDEHKDEEGKKRLKLKVENTIRWKSVPDDEGRIRRESNARMVKWSDGSVTLHLGSEIFDVHKQELMQGENSHLFVRQGLGLQGQAVFRTKLSFRPHSTDSFTHRKMTLSLADKSSKTNKIRVLPNVGLDPEARRSELIKKEEDKLKASIRRENKQKRTRERAIHRGPSAAYLEPDYEEEDEDGAISLSAIKSNYKSRVQDPAYSRTRNYSPEQDSGDDSDFDLGKAKSEKKKARIVESDEED